MLLLLYFSFIYVVLSTNATLVCDLSYIKSAVRAVFYPDPKHWGGIKTAGEVESP